MKCVQREGERDQPMTHQAWKTAVTILAEAIAIVVADLVLLVGSAVIAVSLHPPNQHRPPDAEFVAQRRHLERGSHPAHPAS